MRQLFQRTFSHSLQVLSCLFLCLLFAACSNVNTPHNPDYCTVMPPSGYPEVIIDNGIIYMQSESSGSLYALSISDGSVLWKYHDASLLAVENGMAYVTGTNDTVYSLDAKSGAIRWHYDMSKDVSGVVAVVDGTVYLTSSNSLTLYTLRGSDGQRLWQQKIDADHYPSTILAANGIVYVAAEYSRITAFRESDGTQLWQYNSGAEPPANPLSMELNNGIVYASSNQTVALNATTGTLLWQSPVAGSMAIENGIAFVSSDQLYALRATDGSQLWHWQFPTEGRQYNITVSGNMVYTGPASGLFGFDSNHMPIAAFTEQLYALNGENGTVVWNRALAQTRTAVSIADGTVYTLSSGSLDAWKASDGTFLWHQPLQQVGLYIDGGVLYAGTAGNTNQCFPTTQSKLVALHITDGTLLWQFASDAVSNPTLN